LTADRVSVDAQGRLVAEGAVEVWHRSVRLTAARVVYDPATRQLSVQGPIVIQDGPDRIFLADAAELDSELREGIVRSARLVLNQQLQIAAAELRRRDANVTEMEGIIASSCHVCPQNPTPLWEIRAARVTHDQEARSLRFEGAQFRFAGVPILYLPVLPLPDPTQDRARGFLVPRFRASSRLGFGVTLPYFIPLGPSRDLTLAPTFTTGRMVALSARYRQALAFGGVELGGQIARDRLEPGRTRGHVLWPRPLRPAPAADPRLRLPRRQRPRLSGGLRHRSRRALHLAHHGRAYPPRPGPAGPRAGLLFAAGNRPRPPPAAHRAANELAAAAGPGALAHRRRVAPRCRRLRPCPRRGGRGGSQRISRASPRAPRRQRRMAAALDAGRRHPADRRAARARRIMSTSPATSGFPIR
jgi:hypothetical protein